MATYVEAGRTGLLLDPGATIAPSRSGLPPTEEEWEALHRARGRIAAYAARAALVFVSHYHEDHFTPEVGLYAGRTAVLKDPRRMVQGLQHRRAAMLWKALAGPARVEAADGREWGEGDLRLEVSPPLAHGVEGTPLGYVVALTVVDPAERERFVFASDVQGPLSPVATAWIVRQRPTLLYLSGPPSYIEREVGAALIDRGIEQLLRIVETTGCRVILDHHAVRDVRWRARLARLWETGRVDTAARYLGLEEAPLETRRRELWARARKPAAKASGSRAIITAIPSRRPIGKLAKEGGTE